MAAVLDQITLATLAEYPDLNREVLSRDCPALRMLQEKAVRKGGKSIDVTVRYKRNNGGWYSGYDQFDTAHVDQLAQGTLQWKNVYVNVTIDEDTLVENAGMNIRDLMSIRDIRRLGKRDRHTIFNIFGEEFAGAVDDIKDKMATGIYSDGTGDGGKQVTGFAAAIDDDNTYAGIAYNELGTFDYTGILSGTNDQIWASKKKDLSSASLDLSTIADVLNDCAKGAHSPSWAFLPRDLYSALALQLEGQKTRPNPDISQIGFRNNIEWLEFGVTFFRDEYCPSGTVYFVNPEFMKLYIHPALDMSFSSFKEPTDQAAITGQLKCKMQLVSTDRAKQGVIVNAVA